MRTKQIKIYLFLSTDMKTTRLNMFIFDRWQGNCLAITSYCMYYYNFGNYYMHIKHNILVHILYTQKN